MKTFQDSRDSPKQQFNLFGPPVYNENWRPSAPPSLEGITEIELDTETTGLEWHSGDRPIGIAIGFYRGKERVNQYLPWGHTGGNLSEDTVKRWAERELRGKNITNMNIKFDIHMFREWGIDLEAQGNTVSDISHYAALLDDHRRRFNLDQLGTDFLGVGKVEGTDIDKNNMAGYHAGDVRKYAEWDTELVDRLKQKMIPMLQAQDLMRVKQLEDDVIFPVCSMEKNAARLDTDLLRKWLLKSEQQYGRLMWELAKEVGFQCSPDKTSDMVRLFSSLHLEIPRKMVKRDNGEEEFAITFDDMSLHHVQHPIVQKVRRIRKLKSLRSKFLIPYSENIEKYGLLRFNLHQLRSDEGGTISGRFSSSKVNVQQVVTPERQKEAGEEEFFIRNLFIPEDGYLFLTADAAQIEYRVFASYSNSNKILEAYRKDPKTDFHNIVMELIKVVRKDITRKHTKNVNFAFIFGAGLKKIAYMVDLPKNEARRLVNSYTSAFPEAAALLSQASRLASERGYVRTVLGRRGRFPFKARLHKALNSVIQGTAADINKRKIVELHKESKKIGFRMRFTVHDEACGDAADQNTVEKVREILNRQSFPEIKVPILWEVGAGRNWAEAK